MRWRPRAARRSPNCTRPGMRRKWPAPALPRVSRPCVAGEALLRQAERGLSQGMKSELDVVQARVQWQTAQRDQQRALSDLIRSAVRIKTLMANMDMEGLAAIERFWVRPSHNARVFGEDERTPLIAESLTQSHGSPKCLNQFAKFIFTAILVSSSAECGARAWR